MGLYLAAIGAIVVLLGAMIFVERLYKHFAARHPELGPYRKEGAGCGMCGGDGGSCHGECEAPSETNDSLR